MIRNLNAILFDRYGTYTEENSCKTIEMRRGIFINADLIEQWMDRDKYKEFYDDINMLLKKWTGETLPIYEHVGPITVPQKRTY